jgi:hypothetical protein
LKISFYLFIILLSTISFKTHSEIKSFPVDSTYKQIPSGQSVALNNVSFCIASVVSDEKAYLALQSFSLDGTKKAKNVPVNFAALVAAQTFTNQYSNEFLYVYMDTKGDWRVALIDSSFKAVRKSELISKLSLATESIATSTGYAVGGIDKNDSATIKFLSKSLIFQSETTLLGDKKGQVSSVFAHNNSIIVISNHEDGTSYLHRLTETGKTVSTKKVAGSAATAIPLSQQRGIILAYRIGNEFLVEKLDRSLNRVWIVGTHTSTGTTTRVSKVLDLNNGIAVLSGTDGRLIINRLTEDGKLESKTEDNRTGYGLPLDDVYACVASIGIDIHIRSQAIKTTGSALGRIESTYLIDKK